MDTTYQKTDDGTLAVITTESTTQTYSLTDLQAQLAQYQEQMDAENANYTSTVATIQADIDQTNALITQATQLGVE